MEAIILGRSKIDIDSFTTSLKTALGRSVSSTLDRQGYDPKTPAGYLTMLAAMSNPDAQITSTLEDPGHLLQHLFYTFLVICDPSTRIDIIQRTPLSLQYADSYMGLEICVVSENLEKWRTAIINCCSEQSPYNTRLLFGKILILFETEGLSKVWSYYVKKSMPDKTFKLLERE